MSLPRDCPKRKQPLRQCLTVTGRRWKVFASLVFNACSVSARFSSSPSSEVHQMSVDADATIKDQPKEFEKKVGSLLRAEPLAKESMQTAPDSASTEMLSDEQFWDRVRQSDLVNTKSDTLDDQGSYLRAVSSYDGKAYVLKPADTYSRLAADILAGPRIVSTPFVNIRFGDFEMSLVTSSPLGGNSDGVNGNANGCLGTRLKDLLFDVNSAMTVSQPSGLIGVGTFFLRENEHASWVKQFERILSSTPSLMASAVTEDSKNNFKRMELFDAFYLPHMNWYRNASLLLSRPTVIVGPTFLQSVSCAFLPSRVGFIQGPSAGESQSCNAETENRILTQMDSISRSFPQDSVIFLMSAGPFGKIISGSFFFGTGGVDETQKMRKRLAKKDVFLDTGSALDAAAGHATRDYNGNWKKNCESFGAALLCQTCAEKCDAKYCSANCQSDPVEACLDFRAG